MRSPQIVPNGLRTRVQNVGTAGAVLDLDFLSPKDNIISVTIIPEAADTVSIEGFEGDDAFILPEDGYSFFIRFRPQKPNELPFMKALATTKNLTILVAIERG